VLFVAGVDEVGRGPLAGPVTACCLVIHPGKIPEGVTDSKAIPAHERERLSAELIKESIAYSIVSVGPRRIESLNIRGASIAAMSLAIRRVRSQLEAQFGEQSVLHVLSDGNLKLETTCSQESIIKGDLKIKVIGAASILAKVSRDQLMVDLSKKYPGYGFEIHKGYGTPKHRQAISLLSPSLSHRRSFAGVREHLPLSKNDQAATDWFLRAEGS